MNDEKMTDSELARELAGYVLHQAELHLGLRGCEIDMDEEVYHMEQMLAELRKDFEVSPEPPPAEPPTWPEIPSYLKKIRTLGWR